MIFHIFTDGSAVNNKKAKDAGTGSYYYVILDHKWNIIHEFGEFREQTTNSRTEMEAPIRALEFLKEIEDSNLAEVNIYTDCQFVVNSINRGWLKNWQREGTLEGRLNEDLWRQMIPLINHRIRFHHVKGHQKDNTNRYVKYNNHCDFHCNELRRQGISKALDNYYNGNDDFIQKFKEQQDISGSPF